MSTFILCVLQFPKGTKVYSLFFSFSLNAVHNHAKYFPFSYIHYYSGRSHINFDTCKKKSRVIYMCLNFCRAAISG